MKRYILITATLLISTISASAQISGRIFHDTNKNGIFDRGELPVAKVAVSDGKSVVMADKNGKYILSGHEKEKFVFLTTPSGFNVTNKHYHLLNSGKTTGYDFGLQPITGKINRDGSHTFIQITDTEISGKEGHQNWIDNVRHYAADQGAAFVMHTGDICYEKGLTAHIELMNDENMGMPMRYAVGNHDYIRGAYGEEYFEKLYGPIYYSFNVGNTHYVVTPMPHGDYKPGFSQQLFLEWLKNDLATMTPNQTLVVFNHDLLIRNGKFIWGKGDSAVNLATKNLRAWIYGHLHINHVKNFGSVTTICSSTNKGGIDHSVATFRRVDVNRSGVVTSKLIYPYIDNALMATICGVSLSVNAYHTDSPIISVQATYVASGRKTTIKLPPTTDWNYRALLPVNASNVVVAARCNNGQTLMAQASKVGDSTFTMVWSSNVGSNIYMSSPIALNGKIYVGVVDESLAGKAGVACFDAQNGGRLWFYNTRNSVKNSIAAASSKIFAQDTEGYLYAINAENGTLIWEQKLTVADPLPSVVEGLAVYENRLYAGTGKGLTALDFNGKVIWRNTDWGQNEGTTSNFAFTNKCILTGSQWQALFANDLQTGKMVWRADRDGLRFRASTPLIANGVAYVLSDKSLFLLDPATGAVIFRKELPYDVQVTSQPLLTDKAIIFGTTDAGIRALDIHTFEPLWAVETGPGLIYTVPYQLYPTQNIESSAVLTPKGNVLIGAADGVVRVIDPKNGYVLQHINIGAPILSTFLVEQNACYVSDYAGNVHRFDTIL